MHADGLPFIYFSDSCARDFSLRLAREQRILQHCIQGLTSEREQQQYATLILQRLLVLFFLQGKGLLNSDPQYLQRCLQRSQQQTDRFFSDWFSPLCHGGIGGEKSLYYALTPTEKLPRLALPLFQRQQLEQSRPALTIPDKAFTRLFAFLNRYQWQLDICSPPTPTSLFPDILAVVFEQQINQKQMGAYYTHSDITSYIAGNTLLPCLLSRVEQHASSHYLVQALPWHLLQQHPRRYLQPALVYEQQFPEESTIEYKQRLARAEYVQERLISGEIHNVADLITWNLNLQHFVLDTIQNCSEIEVILLYIHTLLQIRILDPTCGGGAFLMAALRLLLPLYSACINQLKHLLALPNRKQEYQDRLVQLAPLLTTERQSYAIHKTILCHNLYGVDMMPEAVDLCQLVLYLTLLAYDTADTTTITPFTTFSTHIRHGNALVGFTSFPPGSDNSDGTAMPAVTNFTHEQARYDQHLAQLCIDASPPGTHKPDAVNQWIQHHRPFHWYLEFPEVLRNGGFDVIIGNPPYVEYSKSKQYYQLYGYMQNSYSNLFAATIERALTLSRPDTSYLGLLVPLSLCSSARFAQLRHHLLCRNNRLWLANFDIFPCRLFEGAFQRLSILLAQRNGSQQADTQSVYVTRNQRWYSAERIYLLQHLSYTPALVHGTDALFPRLVSPLQQQILQKIQRQAQNHTLAQQLLNKKTAFFVYYQEATNYWIKATCRIPFYKRDGQIRKPSHGRFVYVHTAELAYIIMALLNSSLFYIWFSTYSDGFHLSHTLVKNFPTPPTITSWHQLAHLGIALEADIQQHAQLSTRNSRPGRRQAQTAYLIELEEYRMACSKPLLDQIDAVLADYYKLTDEELDFVVHYESKFRLC